MSPNRMPMPSSASMTSRLSTKEAHDAMQGAGSGCVDRPVATEDLLRLTRDPRLACADKVRAGSGMEECKGAERQRTRGLMSGIRLVTQAVMTSFADMVYHNQRRVYRVWLITPWLSFDDSRGDALQTLFEALRDKSCSLILITRPPKDVKHQQAIELLRKLKTTTYLCPSLHTKLYILECDGFRGAVLGSPNLTTRGNRLNREIAVELKSVSESPVDEVSEILSQLTEYASCLRGEDDVELI